MTEVTNDYSENLDLIESCNHEINLLDERGDREIYEYDHDHLWRNYCLDIHTTSSTCEHLSDINSIYRDITKNFIQKKFIELYKGDKKKIIQYFYGTTECDDHYIKINNICNNNGIEFCSAFTIYSFFQSKKLVEYVYKNKVSNESSSYKRLFFKMLFSEPKIGYLGKRRVYSESPFDELSPNLFELTTKYKLDLTFGKNAPLLCYEYEWRSDRQFYLYHVWKYINEDSIPIPSSITSIMKEGQSLSEFEWFWIRVKTFLDLVRIYKFMDWEHVIGLITQDYRTIHSDCFNDELNIDNFEVIRREDVINIVKDIFYIDSSHYIHWSTAKNLTRCRYFYNDYVCESKELILFLLINKIYPYNYGDEMTSPMLPKDPVSHLSLNTKSIADAIVSDTNSRHWLPNKLRRSKSFWIKFRNYLCKESKYFRENQKFIYYHIFENINHPLKLDIDFYLNALKEDISLIKKISHRGIEKLDLTSLNASQKEYAFNYFQSSKFYKDKPLLEQALLKRRMLS